MTYLERFNALQAERANVTRERLGFGCNADMLTTAQLEADMKEAQRRIAGAKL